MPINRIDITVANLAELSQQPVAQLRDGCAAWSVADAAFFILEKGSGAAPSSTVIAPIAGSPIAGNADARWILQTTPSGPPTGAAGGDLGGSFPNPTVDGLQGTAVSAAAPVAGNVLTLVGGVWTPQAPAAPTSAVGGDLSGTLPNPTVDGLQGTSVSAAAPGAGSILTLIGGVWTPSPNVVLAAALAAAGSLVWGPGATSVTLSQSTQTSDSPTHQLAIVSQAPFATATGTNQTPGTLLLEVPAAVGGGAEGKLQLGMGGVTGSYFQKITSPFAGFAQFWDGHALITSVDTAAGVGGFSFTFLSGSPAAIGARATGGDITISAGDARGDAGAGTHGGEVFINSGHGSSNDGRSGVIEIVTGTGGAGNGGSGDLTIGTGITQGTGNKGQINIFQGGTSGGTSVKVAYFDIAGVFHLGADADTTNVNLRINGATQTTVGAAGGASALPATPTGYWLVNFKGANGAVPFYPTA